MPTTYTKGRIYKIPLSDLQPDPGQPRKFIDPIALAELTASIAKLGVLEPILFRQEAAGTSSGSPEGSERVPGNLIVVAGERRVEAAKAAGLTQIPGILVDGNHREISLVENLVRQDLTPVEEAEGMKQVMAECNYTQDQLSEMLGKSQAFISASMSLNDLPEDVRNVCRSNANIPKTVLLKIAKAKSESEMQRKFGRFMSKEAAAAQAPKPARPTLSRSQSFLKKMDELHGELVGLSWQNWPDTDKEDLVGRIRDMIQGGKGILDAMGVPLDDREPEKPPSKKLT
ncbi:MAG: ParB/RepB/Spo0J family partition protein [Syntrophales bacterium]|nr:ParB/RepB/Spo0J family partition protein [Syntrophales bacterium]